MSIKGPEGDVKIVLIAVESVSIRGGEAIAKTVQNVQHTSAIHGCFCRTAAHTDTHGSKYLEGIDQRWARKFTI